jgi:hypothetical protein
MNKMFSLVLVILVFSACKKDKPAIPVEEEGPEMQYHDLQNAEVKDHQSKRIDLNNDGITDFFFATLLVGDPVLRRDRLQFYAYSMVETYLLNDNKDQSPVLNKSDEISNQHNGYQWFDLSAIVLAEKITPLTESPFWEGDWKLANHKYLPVYVGKNGDIYYGWIELSFDAPAEKMILHRAALCTEPGQKIKAGL